MGPQKVETMRRPRPERGERRIDAAIDHLAQYGFAKPQIRKVINDLLQTQEAAAAEEALPQNGMEVSRVNGEAPNEPPSTLELQASPSSSPLLLVPPAKGPPCARTPCYGWISEESESESESEDGEMLSDVTGPVIFAKKDIPNPVGTLPSRRK
ncbi:hypothetical protein ZEAMMB73_Zm00001d033190 [Zea mays]|uniref:Uncharacterized protein n=1 Tax=Zea mays TaxID=4577 RepID=A0A1D6KWU5_MAIZE|nr:hypothetical protein ZEAMMB73_Zm00001d033190 [Zea mays]